jgi:hypothetical protein
MGDKLGKISYIAVSCHLYRLMHGAHDFNGYFKTADVEYQETSLTFMKCWASDATAPFIYLSF